jgi:hypothetical protein
MSLRTLMQAGPSKVNELFSKLFDSSDGAVKTREKLFAELKAELELQIAIEEQHLFPVLRRNAETKELISDAIKDNKALRAKLADLDVLPKNDETFTEQLKGLQKAFRQHSRDEKRELLPAVQRALSEEQVQTVAQKIEAEVAEAGQAKLDELEARRARARQEREEDERRETNEGEQNKDGNGIGAAVQAIGRAAITAAQGEARQTAENVEATTASVGAALRGASIPGIGMVPEIRSAWMQWISETTLLGNRLSHDLLRQTADQNRRLIVETMEFWMAHTARIMQTTMHLGQASLQGFGTHPDDGSRQGGNRVGGVYKE